MKPSILVPRAVPAQVWGGGGGYVQPKVPTSKLTQPFWRPPSLDHLFFEVYFHFLAPPFIVRPLHSLLVTSCRAGHLVGGHRVIISYEMYASHEKYDKVASAALGAVAGAVVLVVVVAVQTITWKDPQVSRLNIATQSGVHSVRSSLPSSTTRTKREPMHAIRVNDHPSSARAMMTQNPTSTNEILAPSHEAHNAIPRAIRMAFAPLVTLIFGGWLLAKMQLRKQKYNVVCVWETFGDIAVCSKQRMPHALHTSCAHHYVHTRPVEWPTFIVLSPTLFYVGKLFAPCHGCDHISEARRSFRGVDIPSEIRRLTQIVILTAQPLDPSLQAMPHIGTSKCT